MSPFLRGGLRRCGFVRVENATHGRISRSHGVCRCGRNSDNGTLHEETDYSRSRTRPTIACDRQFSRDKSRIPFVVMAGRNIPQLAYPGFRIFTRNFTRFSCNRSFPWQFLKIGTPAKFLSSQSSRQVVQASLIRGYRTVFPFSRLAKIIFRKGVRRAASVSITPVSNSAYRYVAIPFRVDRVTRMVTLSV